MSHQKICPPTKLQKSVGAYDQVGATTGKSTWPVPSACSSTSAIYIYMFSSKNELNKLERLQERCINICTRSYGRDNIDNIRSEYKLPKLEKRRICHVNNFMYNRNANIEENSENNIQTRSKSSKKFIVNKPNFEAYKRSIIYSGAMKWNALKNETKNIQIYEAFKYH